MREQFIYAVARIRAKELSLLSAQDVSRLMSCETFEECINVLRDKGWGNETADNDGDYQALLKSEESKLWQLISELVPDKSLFNVVLLPTDFHNLKAAVKGCVTGSLSENLFIPGGNVDISHLTRCVEERNFSELPAYMVEPAKLAFEKLLHTGDGQLCDNIIDRALLETIKIEGNNSKIALIRDYAEFYVASSNIKIAIRSLILNKNINFLNSMLVKCNSLDVQKLASATTGGIDELTQNLAFTPYSDAVPFIKESLQKFEFWRDNKIIELIKAEKYNSFSIGPIIAYILARQNEFKVVRIILSGKLHCIENDLIKERLRMMYA